MRLSAKSDYALRALFHLAELYRGENTPPLSIRILAEKNDIPRRFLEQIMIDLRQMGWVRSIPGRDGGFILGKDPQQITMGEIIRYFDEIIAPIDCVSQGHYVPCSQESKCRFRRVLLEIRNITAAIMDQATLAKVVAGKTVAREEVLGNEFIDGAGI